jgi:hypothetical protein
MIRIPNRTAQAATYKTGTPNYVDVSAGAAVTGMVTFSAKAADDLWTDGDTLGIVIRKDDSNYKVWTATWDATNEYLEMGTEEESVGTISDDDAVTVTASMTAGQLEDPLNVIEYGSFSNPIINGAFDVWQLGTSFVTPAHTDITADRWLYGQSVGGATWTVTRETDVPAAASVNYSLKIACTGSDASLDATEETHMRYGMEGQDFAKFVGKTVTLGFWVKSSTTGTYCVAFVNGGSDRSYIAEYAINAADTWEYKEVTLTFDYSGGTWNYTTGIGLKIRFTLRAGSNFQTTSGSWESGNYLGVSGHVDLATNGRYLQIADVTLNPGTKAQKFVRPTIAEELTRCLRYLEVFDCSTGGVNAFTGYAASTGAVNFDIPVYPKRVPPTTLYFGTVGSDYVLTDISTSPVTSVTFTDYARSNHIWKMQATKTSAFTVGAPYVIRLVTTSGKIAVTAELYT